MFRQEDKILSNTRNGGNTKLIKNPYQPNQRRVVPSDEHDFTWQNARREVQVDINRLVDTNANWSRNNYVINQVDRTASAIPQSDQFRKRIRGRA